MKVEQQNNGTFYVSCPANWNLLFCEMSPVNLNVMDEKRHVIPIDNKTCECSDITGIRCGAWCTDKPLLNLEFRVAINTVNINDVVTTTCPEGKRAISCHWKPTKIMYPAIEIHNNGNECACYDFQGGQCMAMCATNVRYFEIVGLTSLPYSSVQQVSCNKPQNKVLSCGYTVRGAEFVNYLNQNFKVVNDTTCECTAIGSYFTCYAICGILY